MQDFFEKKLKFCKFTGKQSTNFAILADLYAKSLGKLPDQAPILGARGAHGADLAVQRQRGGDGNLKKFARVPDGYAILHFDAPVSALTPGQSAVIYDGDVVVGGGIIEDNRLIKRYNKQ